MSDLRAWVKRTLSPSAVEALRSARHASVEAFAGRDLYQVRIDLERHIEERLRETEEAQDARLITAIREEIAVELDRWAQDMLDRMDILLDASNRTAASLESRVAELESRLQRPGDAANGVPAADALELDRHSVSG